MLSFLTPSTLILCGFLLLLLLLLDLQLLKMLRHTLLIRLQLWTFNQLPQDYVWLYLDFVLRHLWLARSLLALILLLDLR